jgi:hypothetical protein
MDHREVWQGRSAGEIGTALSTDEGVGTVRLVNNKSKVKYAVSNWARQYSDASYGADKQEITKALKALNQPTASDIESIIGNESWTKLSCDECSSYVENAVHFGEYESHTICYDCVKAAARMIPPL